MKICFTISPYYCISSTVFIHRRQLIENSLINHKSIQYELQSTFYLYCTFCKQYLLQQAYVKLIYCQ